MGKYAKTRIFEIQLGNDYFNNLKQVIESHGDVLPLEFVDNFQTEVSGTQLTVHPRKKNIVIATGIITPRGFKELGKMLKNGQAVESIAQVIQPAHSQKPASIPVFKKSHVVVPGK